MIDRHPVPGNYSEWLEGDSLIRDAVPQGPLLHDTPPVRASSVLGPDGNPLLIDLPRRRVGFDLSKKDRVP